MGSKDAETRFYSVTGQLVSDRGIVVPDAATKRVWRKRQRVFQHDNSDASESAENFQIPPLGLHYVLVDGSGAVLPSRIPRRADFGPQALPPVVLHPLLAAGTTKEAFFRIEKQTIADRRSLRGVVFVSVKAVSSVRGCGSDFL
jgi:hypothetical protein